MNLRIRRNNNIGVGRERAATGYSFTPIVVLSNCVPTKQKEKSILNHYNRTR